MDFGPSGFYGADRICAGWPEGGALFVTVLLQLERCRWGYLSFGKVGKFEGARYSST